MKKILILTMTFMLALGTSACSKNAQAPTGANVDEGLMQSKPPKEGDEVAVITTTKGEIKMMFYPDDAPKAVENFKSLSRNGYYDGISFHRVINNFMIQGGDPTATGTGGESMWNEDFEIEVSPRLHFFRGAVAMANTGQPKSNGSQFFFVQSKAVNEERKQLIDEVINEDPSTEVKISETESVEFGKIFTPEVMQYYEMQGGSIELEWTFGNAYTIFGQIYEGIEIVDAIAAVEVDENDKPLDDVLIEKIEFVAYESNK